MLLLKIWRAVFSWHLRFEIRPFALSPTRYSSSPERVLHLSKTIKMSRNMSYLHHLLVILCDWFINFSFFESISSSWSNLLWTKMKILFSSWQLIIQDKNFWTWSISFWNYKYKAICKIMLINQLDIQTFCFAFVLAGIHFRGNSEKHVCHGDFQKIKCGQTRAQKFMTWNCNFNYLIVNTEFW